MADVTGGVVDQGNQVDGDNDFTPFKNLFNDFYAKDTSRKIRAVKKAQAERGERVGTRAPSGYKKRFTEIPELTGELLHLFIERIEVGERAERYSRTAEQNIVIRYKDINILGAFAEEAQKIAV